MKCAFIYFSGTGITPKFATEIAKGISQCEESTFDFIRIKKGKIINLAKYDLIGIGAPSYSLRAPRLTTKILRKMNFQKKPFFVFATYNTMVGNTLWNIYRAVRYTTGHCLGYIKGSITINIRAWKAKKNSSKKMKEISGEVKNQANEFGKLIVERFNLIKINPLEKQIREWIPPVKILLVIWAAIFTWRWEMLLTVGFKRVDKNKCTKCGLCASQICPSNAIKLTEDKTPIFKEFYCVGCNGCVNLCPTDAIWTYQTKNKQAYDIYKNYILEGKNNK
ncbi:MAG: EFR1 family ferrodoxin [Candidatus Heimdallarchaeota archaeon]|nr:EFR1 family ferrodoxin [Candidatus Heimdallarchaeota archaeon]